MFRIILWLTLAAGLALASSPVTSDDIDDIDVEVDKAEVKQTITVEIPPRYALHLVTTDWVLDLGALTEDDECYLVPKGVRFGPTLFKAYQRAWFLGTLTLSPAAHYPAVILDESGNVAVDAQGRYRKGSLICFFSKVLQKFTNVPNWQLEVNFTTTRVGFGNFLLSSFLDGSRILTMWGSGTYFGGSTDRYGTTGGWLDSTLVEGFWFDGTEAAGDYDITVTFTLTEQWSPLP